MILRVHLDGVSGAEAGDLGGLDGYRAAAAGARHPRPHWEGPKSISASTMARISAGVSKPRSLGLDCRKASSGLPKELAACLLCRSIRGLGFFRTQDQNIQGENCWPTSSASSQRVTRSLGAPRFSQT